MLTEQFNVKQKVLISKNINKSVAKTNMAFALELIALFNLSVHITCWLRSTSDDLIGFPIVL